MTSYRVDHRPPWHKSKLWHVSLALLGIFAFVIIGIALEDEVGIPFDTTYRVACAFMCLIIIYGLGLEYPGERWPQVGFWLAILVNVGVFFTPLVDRPTSRGELMLFALPDAIIVLVARIASYRAEDVHQRAMRQQMILALVVVIVFCAALFAAVLLGPQPTP